MTTAAVERYLAAKLEAGAAPKTLLNHRSALSAFCRFLCGRGLLAANPCAAVRLRRPDQQLREPLDDGEIRLALAIAREHRFWPEVCLDLSTVLRVSEMIRLKWIDVDFEHRCLTVRRSKSGRPRVVPLNRSAVLALRVQRRRSGRFTYVFPARQTWRGGCCFRDRPRAINWWGRVLRPIQEAIPKFRELPGKSTGRGWHLFRHTAASRLARANVSLFRIGAILGHKHAQTTAIYAHLQSGYDPVIEHAAVGGSHGKRRKILPGVSADDQPI